MSRSVIARRLPWGSRLSKAARYGATLLAVSVGLVSYRYVAGAQSVLVPPNVLANRFFSPWIVIHAIAAATALILGAAQLPHAVGQLWPWLHRASGRLYVLGCLAGGASALVLSAGVSTGPVAAAGFGALGVLWLYATAQGLRGALARDFPRHRAWMMRSYALTFAAVTLRLYLPLSQILGIDFALAYPCIAWLCWVPNGIIVEAWLRRSARSRPVPSEAASPPARP